MNINCLIIVLTFADRFHTSKLQLLCVLDMRLKCVKW